MACYAGQWDLVRAMVKNPNADVNVQFRGELTSSKVVTTELNLAVRQTLETASYALSTLHATMNNGT